VLEAGVIYKTNAENGYGGGVKVGIAGRVNGSIRENQQQSNHYEVHGDAGARVKQNHLHPFRRTVRKSPLAAFDQPISPGMGRGPAAFMPLRRDFVRPQAILALLPNRLRTMFRRRLTRAVTGDRCKLLAKRRILELAPLRRLPLSLRPSSSPNSSLDAPEHLRSRHLKRGWRSGDGNRNPR
jgi:hypothetical protein